MTKKKMTMSINVLSVLIILVSLCIGLVGRTNSWFVAEHNEGVQIIVKVGDLKLSLYQTIDGTTNRVYSYSENMDMEENERVFVELGEVDPSTLNVLQLQVANDDPKSVPMYIKFKFEVYARGVNSDTLLSTTISGFTAWSDQQAGFKKNDTDEFYYYKSADGNNKIFEKGETQTLLTGFEFNYDNISSYTSSESIYLKLTIDGSVAAW